MKYTGSILGREGGYRIRLYLLTALMLVGFGILLNRLHASSCVHHQRVNPARKIPLEPCRDRTLFARVTR